MVDVRSLRLFVPRQLRALPADLAGAVVVTVAVNVAVLVPLIRETPLRIPLGLAFVLFVPGYVLVAALFPERGDRPTEAAGGTTDQPFHTTATGSGIGGAERVVLSVGVSLVVVPLIALLLTLSPWGLHTAPFVIGVSAVTLFGAAAATARRWAVPDADRFRVPYRTWLATLRARLLEPDTRGDAALNVLLVASVLLAAGAVGYAVAVPQDGDSYSEVALLTETEDGDLEFVDGDHPLELEGNESDALVLRIDNHEHRTAAYTVVVVEQEAEVTDEGVVVHEQREIDRFETALEHEEIWLLEHDVEPTATGDDARLAWLVYPGDVPDDPSTENAPYAVDRWVEPAAGDEPEDDVDT